MPTRRRNRSLTRRSSFSDGEELLDKEDPPELPVKKKVTMKSVLTRACTAFTMIGAYIAMLRAGHFYCILVGFFIQCELYRELVNVRYVEAKERDMPYFRSLQWGWFALAMSWAYGETIADFSSEHPQFQWLLPFLIHRETLSFVLYCILFVISVLYMKKDIVRFQISQYMWSFVTILLVVVQCKFFASYTLKGLFWFFFPMATVVMNDVSAYFCGISMGRKFIKAPFLSLSPNKTWEGFIGAAFLTLIFSFFFPVLLSQFKHLTCPAENITMGITPELTCDVNSVFLPHAYTFIVPILGTTINTTLLPIQLHGLVYGIFASLIAPFGGFFASAIKRAYGMKDFDNLFPGHGGMMDRMDCVLFMMGFTSFHYQHYIATRDISVSYIISLLSNMSSENQQKVLMGLQSMTSA